MSDITNEEMIEVYKTAANFMELDSWSEVFENLEPFSMFVAGVMNERHALSPNEFIKITNGLSGDNVDSVFGDEHD